MLKRLLILGAGGHGRSVADAASFGSTYAVVGFLDDAKKQKRQMEEWPILGEIKTFASLRNSVDAVIVGIGNNTVREALHKEIKRQGVPLATVIHPSAYVSPRAIVGPGTVILAGASVGIGTQLGEGVIVNSGAVIDHDCQVDEFGHLGVNAAMSGGSTLGRRAWMPIGALLLSGATVSPDRILQAGEVVVVANRIKDGQ